MEHPPKRRRRIILPYALWLKPYARKLRRQSTFPERLLWSRLRRKQLGVTFLRQRSIRRYIVDFYCPDHLLAIEVDGRSHDFTGEKDAIRQRLIESLGVTFLRFENDEVLSNLDGVVEQIALWLEAVLKAPPCRDATSPWRGKSVESIAISLMDASSASPKRRSPPSLQGGGPKGRWVITNGCTSLQGGGPKGRWVITNGYTSPRPSNRCIFPGSSRPRKASSRRVIALTAARSIPVSIPMDSSR